MKQDLFIGELARRADMNARTIRYYEGLGLLSEPRRTDSGYRIYAETDAERLKFIRGAKTLGLSLDEIKQILGIWSAGATPCGTVSRLLDDKLANLDLRIQELTQFRDELRAYKARVDIRETGPDVPCKHIQGVTLGEWNPAIHEPTPELHRSCS